MARVDSETSTLLLEQVRDVLDRIQAFGFVAGGAARAWALHGQLDGKLVEDIDVYVEKEEYYEGAKAALVRAYYDVTDTTYATAFRGRTYPVQLIRPVTLQDGRKLFGTVDEVLAGFNLTVEQFAVVMFEGDKILSEHGPTSLFDAKNGNIRLARDAVDPAVAMGRVLKYLNKGFHMPPAEFGKLLAAWDGVDEARRKAVLERMGRMHGTGDWGQVTTYGGAQDDWVAEGVAEAAPAWNDGGFREPVVAVDPNTQRRIVI